MLTSALASHSRSPGRGPSTLPVLLTLVLVCFWPAHVRTSIESLWEVLNSAWLAVRFLFFFERLDVKCFMIRAGWEGGEEMRAIK